MEPLYRGHIGTLETVLYIEVVLNSEVIYSGTSHIGTLETILYIEVVLNSPWNLSMKNTLVPWN